MRYQANRVRFSISKRLVVLISFGMILLSVVNIVLSAELSHYGTRLAELAIQEDQLLLVSEAYLREMVEVDALTQLSVVAREQGFTTVASAMDLSRLSTIAYTGN